MHIEAKKNERELVTEHKVYRAVMMTVGERSGPRDMVHIIGVCCRKKQTIRYY